VLYIAKRPSIITERRADKSNLDGNSIVVSLGEGSDWARGGSNDTEHGAERIAKITSIQTADNVAGEEGKVSAYRGFGERARRDEDTDAGAS